MNYLRFAATQLTVAAISLSVVAGPATKLDKYVAGTNSFGMKVFQNLAQKNNNVLYSPVAMNTALSIVAHFAEPKTQENMIRALGIKTDGADGMSINDFNEATKSFTKTIADGNTKRYTVNLATSFWLDKEFQLSNDSKVDAAGEIYGAKPTNSYLFSDSKSADAMNAWVDKATSGRIKQLVTAEEVAPLEWAAISAIYFKGLWFNKFGASHKGAFMKTDGTKADAQYMEASPSDGASLLETPEMKVVELAYGQQEQGKKLS